MTQDTSPAGQSTLTPFILGPFQTNSYIVRAEGSPACWIIDAPFDPAPILASLRDRSLKPTALLLTHAHVDHIAGVTEIRSAYPDLPILLHELEHEWLNDPVLNLSEPFGVPITAPSATGKLEHGQTLELDGQAWKVLHTPGHSPGSVSFYHAPSETAIVGDTLFAGSIGRSDFPGSSHEQLVASIRTHLYTLPASTRVYPGHGPSTSIAREMATNPYVRAQS